MGSTLSFHNNTDDVIMVKLTANTKVLVPIITGVGIVGATALTALTAGAAAPLLTVGGIAISGATAAGVTATATAATALLITRTAVSDAEKALESGYEREGFHKVMPGKTWKHGKQTLSLNQRMWLIRLDTNKDKTTIAVRTADSSVWTGATNKSNNSYKATDKKHFKWKTVDFTKRGGAQDPRAAQESRTLGDTITAMGGKKIEMRGGATQALIGGTSRRFAGLVTGLLLGSPLHKTPALMGISNKNHGLGAPKASFGSKIDNLLGNGDGI